MATKKLPSREDYEREQAIEEAAVVEALRSEVGKTILRHLDATYCNGVVSKVEGKGVDVHQTLINVGAYAVVEYLKGLADREE